MALRTLASACAIQTLLSVLSTGCGGSLDSRGAPEGDGGGLAADGGALGTEAFPVGTYTTCVEGTHDNVLNAAGFQSGAVLTLSQSGGTLTAAYVDQNGATSSFDFAQTTSTTATLAPSGQTASGFSGQCVEGPGNDGFYPAILSATAGSLTYDEGMVFVTLDGTLQDDAGPCGAQSIPDSFWLLCEDRQGGVPSPEPAGGGTTASAPQLPVGPYACSSQVETYEAVDGTNEYVAGGSNGTLTLTQTGADVTAEYSSDSAIAGMLLLTATTETTASAAASQTLAVPCAVPIGAASGLPSPAALSVAAGSLTVVGSTLFLSFAGTMAASSSCSGAQVAGSLICSKQ